MKPALVKRVLLTLCGIAAVGGGYRSLVAVTRTPAATAAINGPHRDDARARTVAVHRQSSRHADPHTAAPATPRARLVSLRAPLSVESTRNPFAASSWLPPPPPVVVPVVPEVRAAPPTAPPVPFTYMGQLDAKKAKPQVFLSSGDRLLIVSPGDVVDEQYRVESVSESDVVLTYLPLNLMQVVSIPREGK
ncbi:hypothetical protein P3T23_003668 [Paraburkholderia sp. GAS448]|uniref:hypothetical protein n=1 Tax=Paraburkholderia sp. GAS448 TaxID=3035136 RepID=UPI003D1ADCD7